MYKKLLKIIKTILPITIILTALALTLAITNNAYALALPFFHSGSAANNSSEQATKSFSLRGWSTKPPAQVLNLALRSYQNAINRGIDVTKPILTIIDYSMPSTAKRLWVIDLQQRRVLFNTLVAHGENSGATYARQFSNQFGSLKSSIGAFLTGNTYMGHRGYTLRIKGLDSGFNTNAEARHIVIHGAWYVSEALAKLRGTIGRSWGCPAVEPKMAAPIINTIKDGSFLFVYYPDSSWLHRSKFIATA